mgnify:CR=1 FL=1
MREETDVANNRRIVYFINVEDLQRVANDELSRDLTIDEIKIIEDKIGDYIPWYDTIASLVYDVIVNKNEEESM